MPLKQTNTADSIEHRMKRIFSDEDAVAWDRLSRTLQRSLLLAGGFMDVTTAAANVHEIAKLLRK